jgi:hypothetical protein
MRVCLVLVALAVTVVGSPAAAADELRKGPYLQHLTGTDVDVRVELATALPLTVTVAADGGDGGAAPPRTITSPAASFHSVHIGGLAPDSRYAYTVRAGSTARGGAFVTAPAGASHRPFTFVVYGDNRSDGGTHARIAEAISKESFDFLIQTGDLVVTGADESAWQSFFDVESSILRDHCLFAAVGNHELHNDRFAAHFERYFAPTEPAAGSSDAAPLYGSFRWGRARFFVLNAFEEWGPGKERTWLEQALALADREAGVDLRVAVIHHGPYSAGPHGNNDELLAAHIDELLAAHHVDLVLSGHDHIYERGQAGPLKYLVTGGAGAPLYREIKAIPSTRKVEATYHYILATVTDAGVAIVAKRPDGSVVDQCSFARGGPWLCDPAKAEVAPDPNATTGATHAVPQSPGSACGCDTPGHLPGSWGALAAAAAAAIVASARRRPRRRLPTVGVE